MKFRTSLNNIITNNYQKISRIALNIAGNRTDADDLLHSVLAGIYASDAIDPVVDQGESKVLAYITQCLHISWNSTRSAYYYQYRKNIHYTESSADHIAEPEPQDITARITNENLDLLLNKLPEMERRMMLLYAMPGFNYEHLSQSTGIEIRYLYKVIENATKKLRRYAKVKSANRSIQSTL